MKLLKINTGWVSNSYIIGKALILFILLALPLFNSLSQTVILNANGTADIHFNSQTELNKYMDAVLMLDDDNETKDSLINFVYKPALIKCKEGFNNCDSILNYSDIQIKALKEQVNLLITQKPDAEKKLIEFNGLYAGIKTGYLFSDTVFSQSKFIGSLWDNISGYLKTGMSIKDFRFNVYLEIPLSRERKTGIYFEGGYRLL